VTVIRITAQPRHLDLRRLGALGSVTEPRRRRDLLSDTRRYEAANARRVLAACLVASVIGLVLVEIAMMTPEQWWIAP
jgi:hypothetical protein